MAAESDPYGLYEQSHHIDSVHPTISHEDSLDTQEQWNIHSDSNLQFQQQQNDF